MAIYQVTQDFPKEEIYGLTNQLRRAAVSVPSNIAEGQGRGTSNEWIHFLRIAYGSLQEIETQLYIAHQLDYLNQESYQRLVLQTDEVGRLINGLKKSLG